MADASCTARRSCRCGCNFSHSFSSAPKHCSRTLIRAPGQSAELLECKADSRQSRAAQAVRLPASSSSASLPQYFGTGGDLPSSESGSRASVSARFSRFARLNRLGSIWQSVRPSRVHPTSNPSPRTVVPSVTLQVKKIDIRASMSLRVAGKQQEYGGKSSG